MTPCSLHQWACDHRGGGRGSGRQSVYGGAGPWCGCNTRQRSHSLIPVLTLSWSAACGCRVAARRGPRAPSSLPRSLLETQPCRPRPPPPAVPHPAGQALDAVGQKILHHGGLRGLAAHACRQGSRRRARVGGGGCKGGGREGSAAGGDAAGLALQGCPSLTLGGAAGALRGLFALVAEHCVLHDSLLRGLGGGGIGAESGQQRGGGACSCEQGV